MLIERKIRADSSRN